MSQKHRRLLMAVCALSGIMAGCQSWPRFFEKNTPADASAKPLDAFKVFAIYTDQAPHRTHYVPSGYMGDSDLAMSGAYVDTPNGKGPCLRVVYRGDGSKGWAGLYWQDPANNWGTVPGKAGYDLRGATKLTFWARGENGGEKVHDFRMGGIVGQYPDSDEASIGPIRLSKDWHQYTIDLKKKDLRHVIAGFGFTLTKADNAGGITFYLNDIFYTGPDGVFPSTGTYTRVSSEAPAPAVAVSTPMAVPPPMPELKMKQEDRGLRVNFSSHFHFASGKALFLPGSTGVLDELVALISAYPDNHVLIEGHTDSVGDPSYNLQLSRLRAEAVRDYLIKQGGYAPGRFTVVGYGDTRPLTTNATKAGRSLNRRVEVIILKMENK